MQLKETKIGMIPIDWETHKIVTISDTYAGGTPSRDNPNYFLGDIPWVKSTEVNLDEIFTTEEFISEEAVQNSSTRFVDANTIVFALYGATAGQLSWLRIRACVNQAVLAIPIKNPELFSKEYLYHSIKFQVPKLVAISQGGGQPNLSKSLVDKTLLAIPKDITEQQKIASILSSVDDTIKVTRASIAKLERLKKSLMQNLLTGKMKPDGTWRNEDEFYMDEKFGKYPKDWAFGRVKDFFVLQRGHDLTDIEAKDGEYPVVKSNGISINHHEFKSRAPGVVTGRSGTIGNVFYIEKDFWPHNTTLYVKDFCGNLPRYVYYLLIFMRLDIYLAGTGVPTLNRNDIHRLRNTIPKTTNEQQEIVTLLDECGKNINVKIVKISRLEKLKKSLMQKLLTGQVRVK